MAKIAKHEWTDSIIQKTYKSAGADLGGWRFKVLPPPPPPPPNHSEQPHPFAYKATMKTWHNRCCLAIVANLPADHFTALE